MQAFEERVRAELGDNANPEAFRKILTCSDDELFVWLIDLHAGLVLTMQEMQAYTGDETKRGTLELGTRILENRFREALFVTKELQLRLRAELV